MMVKIFLKTFSTVLAIFPPIIAAACYFPLWAERGADTVLSGFGAFIGILAFIPLVKLAKRALSSPGAWMMWLILFLLFLSLSAIADEMVVISFVGLLSNIAAAIIYRLSARDDGEKNE